MRDAVYEAQIVDVIEQDDYQTAANVARIITTREQIKNLHHSNGTVQEYTRLRMREMFGKKTAGGRNARNDYGKGVVSAGRHTQPLHPYVR